MWRNQVKVYSSTIIDISYLMILIIQKLLIFVFCQFVIFLDLQITLKKTLNGKLNFLESLF
jgi:hypothetical protein